MVESTSDLQSSILLEQESNGLYWRLATSNEELSRQRKSAQRFDEAIVQEASFFKRIHGFPWSVMDFVANTDVLSALKKQPFRWYKGVDSGLHTIVERLRHAAQASAWQAAALQQTQANIWAHHNKLTEYQGANSTVAVASCSAVETPRIHWSIYFGYARVHRLIGRNSSVTGPGNAGSMATCTTFSHIEHDAGHRICLKLLWNDIVKTIPTKRRNTHKSRREYGSS
uniref:RxLR effector candidate protein n=1 Tax=Hyaloperonospora arabidopsidis (strain Emoy2) TaxID=559515 RepID=M4BJJ4_HYAAE